jgi:hypothetical protein
MSNTQNTQTNRELNIEYEKWIGYLPFDLEYSDYDFSAVDFALRTMATYSGFEKDQNSYRKMKEMYE